MFLGWITCKWHIFMRIALALGIHGLLDTFRIVGIYMSALHFLLVAVRHESWVELRGLRTYSRLV